MAACAAAMTGPGTAAIATVVLFGDSAQILLGRLFKPAADAELHFETGRILLGHIVDGERTIDQVIIGCEGPKTFAIHCHGNPLIVEAIMSLLQRLGAELLAAGALLTRMVSVDLPDEPVAAEARLALTTVKTIAGARLIAAQTVGGLSGKADTWRRQAEAGDLFSLAADVRRVLHDSDPARLLIEGCTVALIGPANTGKSTLLNTLAGREKAIVTDVEGTTRDWVSADIHIPPLAVTVIDTAGIGADLAAAKGDVEEVSQRKSHAILERADLILLVLDASRSAGQLDGSLAESLLGCNVVVVLNKADLPQRLDVADLPEHLKTTVRISAKNETGLDKLARAVCRVCRVDAFDPRAPVVFTIRQRHLLEALVATESVAEAMSIISRLFAGPVSV